MSAPLWKAALPEAVKADLAGFAGQLQAVTQARDVYLKGVLAALGAPPNARITVTETEAVEQGDAPALEIVE